MEDRVIQQVSVLIDNSKALKGKEEILKGAVVRLLKLLKNPEYIESEIDLTILAYNDEPQVIEEAKNVNDIKGFRLPSASEGDSNLSRAIFKAYELLRNRFSELDLTNPIFLKPIIVSFISAPDHDKSEYKFILSELELGFDENSPMDPYIQIISLFDNTAPEYEQIMKDYEESDDIGVFNQNYLSSLKDEHYLDSLNILRKGKEQTPEEVDKEEPIPEEDDKVFLKADAPQEEIPEVGEVETPNEAPQEAPSEEKVEKDPFSFEGDDAVFLKADSPSEVPSMETPIEEKEPEPVKRKPEEPDGWEE